MIDLHSHTTASDGTLPPHELVRKALNAGLRVLSVTDHDTVGAIEAARKAALEKGGGLRIVPGIELSSLLNGREVHVLGHFLDPENAELNRHLATFRDSRLHRMEAMVARCQELGLDVSMAEVEAQRSGKGSFGRPHLARLLVAKGYATDMQNAFDRWLGRTGPAWVERPMPEGVEAIRLIRGAGGCATVAHPGLSGLTEAELAQLTDAGLAGLEVDHPGHFPEIRDQLRRTAKRLGLCTTAGSDFHAEGPEGSRLGTERMDSREFAAYEARAASPRANR